MPFFDLVPNWTAAVENEYSYLTDVFRSQDGSETRRSQRITPRRTQNFTVLESDGAASDLRYALSRGHNEIWRAPDYTRWYRVQAFTDASPVITFDTIPSWAVAGARFAVKRNKRAYELQIASVTGNDVTLFNPTPFASGPTLAYAVSPCRLSSGQSIQLLVSRAASGRVALEAYPGEGVDPTPVDAPEDFLGTPLYPAKPNWAEVPTMQPQSHREDSDFDKGRFEFSAPEGFAMKIIQFGHTMKDDAARDTVEGFYHFCRGRARQFWAATQQRDLIPVLPVAAGSTGFVAAGSMLAEMGLDRTHRYIEIVSRSGAVQRVEVTSVASDPMGSLVTIDTGADFEISQENLRRISWLHLCRFASDQAQFTHLTGQVSETTLSLQTLEID